MFSFQKKEITTKANEMKFVRDTFEKVLRLTDILDYFSKNPITKDSLAVTYSHHLKTAPEKYLGVGTITPGEWTISKNCWKGNEDILNMLYPKGLGIWVSIKYKFKTLIFLLQ